MDDDTLTFGPEQRQFTQTLRLVDDSNLDAERRRQLHSLLWQMHTQRLRANIHLEGMTRVLSDLLSLLSEMVADRAQAGQAAGSETAGQLAPAEATISAALGELKAARREVQRITGQVDRYGDLGRPSPDFESARVAALAALQEARGLAHALGREAASEAVTELADDYLRLVFGPPTHLPRDQAMRDLAERATQLTEELRVVGAASTP